MAWNRQNLETLALAYGLRVEENPTVKNGLSLPSIFGEMIELNRGGLVMNIGFFEDDSIAYVTAEANWRAPNYDEQIASAEQKLKGFLEYVKRDILHIGKCYTSNEVIMRYPVPV